MQHAQGLALAALSLALTLAMPAAAETASQVFQKVSPSIVVVVTYDAAGKPAELGSGVMLPNRTVATNCHVLKDGTQYRVRYGDKVYPARLDKSDWDRDVCSLSAPDLPAPPVLLGNTKTLQVGAPVYAIGAPEGLQLTLSEGIVSSLRPVGGGSYIQTTAAISPGSSGGGLFDDEGHLLGLTSFFVAQGQQLNFALPVEWIESLAQRSTQRVARRISEVDWLNQAAVLEKKKDWAGLLRWSQAWLKASPGNAAAWFGAGEGYGYAGQLSQAIDAYRQALRFNPQYEGGWYNLGVAYAKAGQYPRSIEAFRQCLHINPQSKEAWSNLGLVYNGAEQYPQAIDAFRQALQIDAQDAEAWDGLGLAYTKIGKFQRAIDAYRQALQVNVQDTEAWDGLGWAYTKIGKFSQSIDAYRQALQVNAQDAQAWDGLGMAYTQIETGQYPKAIGAFREAIRINPQFANAWFGLGLVYYGAGQKARALAVYQHLKTLSPELAQKLFDDIVPK